MINSDLMHAMMIIGAIAVFGLLGRLVFMAMRDRAAKHNPLRDASGGGLIFASLALVAAGIYFNSGHVKTMVMVQRHVVDPITVSVLKRDSCQLSGGDYCVVVFQEDREPAQVPHRSRADRSPLCHAFLGNRKHAWP